MLDKIQALQSQMEEIKNRLDAIQVEGQAESGKIKVFANGNKIVTSVQIAPELLSDGEQLEELLVIAMNRALEQAENVNKSEMQGMAGKLMPGLGSMFGM
jgi:DNA-binding YbaB/EbfC family protein